MTCAENLIQADINRQLNNNAGREDITIKMGDLLARETANLILQTLDDHKKIVTIKLLARGWLISRAVDVLEILKREFTIKYDVETNTSELQNNLGKIINVSEICISLLKK